MKMIPLTKGVVAVVDDEDYDIVLKFKWYAHKHKSKFYAERSVKISGKATTVCLHRFLLGEPHGVLVDHADGNTLNNMRSNLRLCTNGQNRSNSRRNKEAKSGYKGVYFQRPNNRWRASIRYLNKNRHIGLFDTAQDAAMAYDTKAREYFGEFARLNFPMTGERGANN